MDSPALHVENLVLRAPDGTPLLDEVSFSVPRGSLVAIVGPTGAGKTTLLNALTGAVDIDGGRIRVDDVDSAAARRQRIGYVPQDDALHPQLALSRTLDYSATLRLPSVSATERATRVEQVVTELGLAGQVRLPVSSLSGGQRKRASVAVELLAGSDVLVLDEPTSGLDPGYEKSVIETLRELTRRGRTVLAVTHSLTALKVCDLALFLAPGGRVAFFGPPEDALAYFGGDDPADVFLALDAVPGAEWKERFRRHPNGRHRRHTPVSAPAARVERYGSFCSQLATLARRYLDLIRSDRRQLSMLLIQGPALGALLWLVLTPGGLKRSPGVGPDAVTAAVFLAISATWLGAANSVREIVKEQHISRREQGRGLSVGAYVGSKALVLGAFSVVQATILAVVAISRQHVPAHGAVLPSGSVEIVVAAAMAAFAAVTLGLLVSALVNTPDKAMSALPMTLVAQLVLSGGWVSVLTRPGVHQAADLTSARWAVHAFEATVKGDPAAWWSSMLAMAALAAGCLLGVDALLRRRLRLLEGVSPRRVTVALATAGMGVLSVALAATMGGPVTAAPGHVVPSRATDTPTPTRAPNPAPQLLALAAQPPPITTPRPSIPPTTVARSTVAHETATTTLPPAQPPPAATATPPLLAISQPVAAVVSAVPKVIAAVPVPLVQASPATATPSVNAVKMAPTQLTMADIFAWWMTTRPTNR